MEATEGAVAKLPRQHGALGRYVLLELVGHGGMGVVYQAYDPLLDRRIALKLIAPSPATQADVVAEARAMARVQHPNVVTVYDAGVQAAGEFELAYVAMELVTGRTLRQWLDEAARPPEAVLDLFLLAGRGLEAAHAAGLVHRDFKPSNVLLGDDGRVRVSDFGLAVVGAAGATPPVGAAGAGAVTGYSPFAGTPRYMAPEQLHGLPADARCDQFAFCVALYEALFGAHPFPVEDGATAEERRAKILEPPSPPARSRLTARLAPAILRGLAADPAERWPSMHALLAALAAARHRRGRRLALTGAATALLAAAAFLGLREAAAPPRACRQAAGALDEHFGPERRQSIGQAFGRLGPDAAKAWQRVEPILDDWAGRWRTLRIEQCEADRNGARASPSLAARRDCFDRRLGELGALVRELDDPDATVVSFAQSAANSLTPPESCLSVAPPAGASSPQPALRDRVAQVRARVERAQALYRLDKQTAALAEAKAAAAEADAVDWPPLTAEAQQVLAWCHVSVNGIKAAADAFHRAMWAAEAARDDRLRFQSARGLAKIGFKESDYTSAERWTRMEKAIASHLPAEGDREAWIIYDEAVLAQNLGQPKACVRLGEEALHLAERTSPDKRLVLDLMSTLSWCYGDLNQEAQALAYAERALPISEKVNGHEHAKTAVLLTNLGVRKRKVQRYEEALAHHREALAIRERAVGPDNPDCAVAHNNIGNVLRDLGRYDEAEAEYQRALEIWSKAYGPDSPAAALATNGLGRTLLARGRPAEAEPLLRRVLEVRRKKRPPGHPDLVSAVTQLGRALLPQRKREALALFEEARAALAQSADSGKADKAEARFWVARARVELGLGDAGALAEASAACDELDDGPAWKEEREACRAWLAARARVRR